MRQLITFAKPYIGKVMLFTSGAFIGINNYDTIQSVKDYFVSEKQIKTIEKTSIDYLEDLVKLTYD